VKRLPAAIFVITFFLSDSARGDDSSFEETIAPIFEAHCVHCHSGNEPKGGLSLATRETAMKGGDSGPAIEPVKPELSLVVDYISGEKPQMPKGAVPLAPEQVAAIRQWIESGAPWPTALTLADKRAIDTRWWSLETLSHPTVPVTKTTWGHTPLDRFIVARLEAEGLAPSPPTERRTLIRRLTYDLHGLPPTPEEIDAFIADASPDVYERLVDRLLASPRYGERWGRHWLDVVHFGESHGYDKDKPRSNAWPYRDWVIDALNDDVPYSRFIEMQLAGDALFPNDPRGVVATGFVSAGPWDFVGHVELAEGTVDKDIARSNDRDDMVATTASTFLSLTVHCARCHDHKFDPITQRDYYRMQAVFAGTDRADRPYDTDARLAAARGALSARREAHLARKQALDDAVARIGSPEIGALDARLAELNGRLAALPIEPAAASPTLGYHSQIMPARDVTKWVQVDLGRSLAIDQVVLVPAHVVYGGHPGPGFGFPPRFKVELSDDATFQAADVLADETAADFPHPGDAPYRIDAGGKRGRYLRVTATRLWKRTDDFIFALAELIVRSNDQNTAAGAAVTSLDSIEAPPGWAMRHLVDGFSSLEKLAAATGESPSPRQQAQAELEQLGSQRRKLALASLDPAIARELADVAGRLAELDREFVALPAPSMTYAAAHAFAPAGNFTPAKTPRPVHLLHRGDVRSPRDLMAPGGVACAPGPSADFQLPSADDEGLRRAALARWLSDPANVLVRRSIVNRVWQYHFGQAIVDSPNDFGRMGAMPTHPELLDWLVGWFIEQGESLKALHRLILTSEVYRQSSADNAAFARRDSANRYLWRADRRRLDAECVRDAMLFVAGRLDARMGGPSSQQFVFKDDHSPVYDYERFDVDQPAGRRRSVYRFIVRSVPDPFMECLDCADPSILTPKRNTTLTSLQALALLNNPFCVRQSQHLADRVAGLATDAAGQIAAAYRLALAREPTQQESELLAAYAAQFGMANACRVIFNSNEFMFVD
jgi:mono/diheme cytochrome c family protein